MPLLQRGYQMDKLLRYRGQLESGYNINPCKFYQTNEEALADMEKLAKQDLSGVGG